MEDLLYLALAVLGYYGCYRAGHWFIDRATNEAHLQVQLVAVLVAATLWLALGFGAATRLLNSL